MWWYKCLYQKKQSFQKQSFVTASWIATYELKMAENISNLLDPVIQDTQDSENLPLRKILSEEKTNQKNPKS